MKVSKWGNSLAIRLPADLVEKLGVKEGDEIVAQNGFAEESIYIRRQKTREEMWARVAEIRKKANIPADFKFDRDEANSRGE